MKNCHIVSRVLAVLAINILLQSPLHADVFFELDFPNEQANIVLSKSEWQAKGVFTRYEWHNDVPLEKWGWSTEHLEVAEDVEVAQVASAGDWALVRSNAGQLYARSRADKASQWNSIKQNKNGEEFLVTSILSLKVFNCQADLSNCESPIRQFAIQTTDGETLFLEITKKENIWLSFAEMTEDKAPSVMEEVEQQNFKDTMSSHMSIELSEPASEKLPSPARVQSLAQAQNQQAPSASSDSPNGLFQPGDSNDVEPTPQDQPQPPLPINPSTLLTGPPEISLDPLPNLANFPSPPAAVTEVPLDRYQKALLIHDELMLKLEGRCHYSGNLHRDQICGLLHQAANDRKQMEAYESAGYPQEKKMTMRRFIGRLKSIKSRGRRGELDGIANEFEARRMDTAQELRQKRRQQ